MPLARKKVTLVVRCTPLNSVKAAEALRHAVGLTLADNQVTVILLDKAAFLALPQVVKGGEIRKHLDALSVLKARTKVERESLEQGGIGEQDIMSGIEVISYRRVVSELTTAEVTYCF